MGDPTWWVVSTWAERGETEPQPVISASLGTGRRRRFTTETADEGDVYIEAVGVDLDQLIDGVTRLAEAVRTGQNSPETLALLGGLTQDGNGG
jgi:hypothetical protein